MRKLIVAVAAFAMLSISGAAQASVQLGELWINNPNPGNAGIIPPGNPDAKFNTGAIDYNSNTTGYTIGAFLNNPTFSDESAAFTAAGAGAASADNLFLLLTGTVGLLHGDNSFVVGHDDGVVMFIPGLDGATPVVNAPGPTSFSNTAFNVNNPGPAGNYAFSLQYTECCGPPAVLLLTVNNVNPGVPEPATWAMMLVGFGGLGAVMRTRRRQTALA